jgi:IS5 family transposase
MEKVVHWEMLLRLNRSHYPKAGNSRTLLTMETMLHIQLMQQWFSYSDPGMEEVLHDIPVLRRFAGLDATVDKIPGESSILHFRHLLECRDPAQTMLAKVEHPFRVFKRQFGYAKVRYLGLGRTPRS